MYGGGVEAVVVAVVEAHTKLASNATTVKETVTWKKTVGRKLENYPTKQRTQRILLVLFSHCYPLLIIAERAFKVWMFFG